MDCKTASALIMSYVDGTIEENALADLQKHMKECYQCSEEFQLFTEMVKGIEELPMLEPSNNFETNIMEAIDLELYTTRTKKLQKYSPIFISIGMYLTFLITTVKPGIQKNVVLDFISAIQHLTLLSNLWETMVESSFLLMGQLLRGTMQSIVKLATWNTTNFLLVYSFSFLTLVLLLVLIRRTLKGLLNINGGDLRWKGINMEE